jgi:hypothetical protein
MLSSAQYEIVLQSLPDPAFVISRTGRYVGYFGGTDTSVYTDGSALVGRYASDFFPPAAVDYLLQGIDLALKDGRLHVVEYPQSGEKLVAPASGKGPTDVQWFEARLQALPFQVDGEDAVLWVAHNITKRHRLELELKRLSETDALTGLSNRRAPCTRGFIEELIGRSPPGDGLFSYLFPEFQYAFEEEGAPGCPAKVFRVRQGWKAPTRTARARVPSSGLNPHILAYPSPGRARRTQAAKPTAYAALSAKPTNASGAITLKVKDSVRNSRISLSVWL